MQAFLSEVVDGSETLCPGDIEKPQRHCHHRPVGIACRDLRHDLGD